MKNPTRTKITIETRQTIVVRSLGDSEAWCRHCQTEVLALPDESVARLLQIPLGVLYGLIESGKLHAVAGGAESPMICGNSLSSGAGHTQIQFEGERQ